MQRGGMGGRMLGGRGHSSDGPQGQAGRTLIHAGGLRSGMQPKAGWIEQLLEVLQLKLEAIG